MLAKQRRALKALLLDQVSYMLCKRSSRVVVHIPPPANALEAYRSHELVRAALPKTHYELLACSGLPCPYTHSAEQHARNTALGSQNN